MLNYVHQYFKIRVVFHSLYKSLLWTRQMICLRRYLTVMQMALYNWSIIEFSIIMSQKRIPRNKSTLQTSVTLLHRRYEYNICNLHLRGNTHNAMVNLDLELGGGGGVRFCFGCPGGFSCFCDFLFLPKLRKVESATALIMIHNSWSI